jgi:hypothetical protein
MLTISIGSFTYQPVVAEISVSNSGLPHLSFVWGFPVISLIELIRQYDRKAGEAEEWAAKQRFLETSRILKEDILTKYE